MHFRTSNSIIFRTRANWIHDIRYHLQNHVTLIPFLTISYHENMIVSRKLHTKIFTNSDVTITWTLQFWLHIHNLQTLTECHKFCMVTMNYTKKRRSIKILQHLTSMSMTSDQTFPKVDVYIFATELGLQEWIGMQSLHTNSPACTCMPIWTSLQNRFGDVTKLFSVSSKHLTYQTWCYEQANCNICIRACAWYASLRVWCTCMLK